MTVQEIYRSILSTIFRTVQIRRTKYSFNRRLCHAIIALQKAS